MDTQYSILVVFISPLFFNSNAGAGSRTYASWIIGMLSAFMVGAAQRHSNPEISEISEWLCQIPE